MALLLGELVVDDVDPLSDDDLKEALVAYARVNGLALTPVFFAQGFCPVSAIVDASLTQAPIMGTQSKAFNALGSRLDALRKEVLKERQAEVDAYTPLEFANALSVRVAVFIHPFHRFLVLVHLVISPSSFFFFLVSHRGSEAGERALAGLGRRPQQVRRMRGLVGRGGGMGRLVEHGLSTRWPTSFRQPCGGAHRRLSGTTASLSSPPSRISLGRLVMSRRHRTGRWWPQKSRTPCGFYLDLLRGPSRLFFCPFRTSRDANSSRVSRTSFPSGVCCRTSRSALLW